MESKPMKILIIEDDVADCNNFINCIKGRKDVELIAVTDSDTEGLRHVKTKKPEGIILDLELNNSKSGNTDSFQFLDDLKNLKLNYEPIVIVTTHVNSKRTYDVLHRKGVEQIYYKDHPNYSCNYVLNQFINLRNVPAENTETSIEELFEDEHEKISNIINHELELIGITSKLKGKEYIHDAILYLIQNEDSDLSAIQHLTKVHKKSASTITNGIQNAIIHAWRVSAVDDLLKHYPFIVNYETGVPTPMEFVYNYRDKIKKLI